MGQHRHGGHRLAAHHVRPYVVSGRVDVFLHEEDGMVIGAEDAFVLQDRRRRVLVAYAGNELVLGALHGPQHDRVPHVFHRRERRVRRIGQAHVRYRHAALPQRQRRQQPVPVGLHHGLPVHRRYAPVVEHGQRVYGPVVIDAPFQDHVQVHVPAVEFEDLPGVVDRRHVEPAAPRFGDQPLFVFPDPRQDDAQFHVSAPSQEGHAK